MADNNNLLVRLHRWVHRQDENFTTEAFAHVLQRLLDYEPQAAARFLNHLTGGVVDLQPEEVPEVHLRTQITTAAGRPDVEIRSKRHLVYLEAKVESGLGHRQLERYREDLLKSGFPITALVLLTRYPVVLDKAGENPDHCVRWHGIADWLTTELVGGSLRDLVSRHVIEQFIGFLSKRGMTMEQVGPEIITGLHAVCNFLAVLEEAASAYELKLSTRESSKLPEYVGYYMDKQRYWIGFYCEEPGLLYAETYNVQIDVDKASELGKELQQDEDAPYGHVWRLTLNLQAEEVDFFARSRTSQMQCLEKFIGDFIETAKMIEAP